MVTVIMRVVLLQRDLAWGDPRANLQNLDQALDRNPGADLYVLPEMFTTGFATLPDASVEKEPSEGLAWMKAAAARTNAAIAGSIALDTGGKCLNRFYFVMPDGTVVTYDKRHLFTYGGEQERFSAGNRKEIVEWRGWRFLLTVCYDLRFPVWLRNRDDYDAIICVANWPDKRRYHWDTLLRARAIENQCYVLGVNRVGSDPVCNYNGGTVLLDPYGNAVASCPDNTQCECSGEFDTKLIQDYRAKFPVLEDADTFELI